jgi:hypothetical protein
MNPTLLNFFERVATDVDVQPFLDEIAAQPGAWDAATGRQDKIKVQREARAIPLRGLRKSKIGDRQRRDVHESRWTSGSAAYPHARAFLEAFAEQLPGHLGRAKLVCLPPGHRVYPHVDRGEYYRPRNRYHLVLHSVSGSMLRAGDETVRMQPGELWWFDNKQEHEAVNDGEADRIHLIFDVLPETSDAPH